MPKKGHFKAIWDSRGQAIFLIIIRFTESINISLIKVYKTYTLINLLKHFHFLYLCFLSNALSFEIFVNKSLQSHNNYTN